MTDDVEVLAAEATIKRDQRKMRDKDKQALRDAAKAALERAVGKNANPAEVTRVADLVEPGLAATLGVTPAEAPPPPKKPARRRGR